MSTARKNTRTRKQKSPVEGEAKKRGPESWVKGSKQTFLVSVEGEWHSASQAGPAHVSIFYDRITSQWLYMYGYELPLPEDNPDHETIPESGLDKIPFIQGQPPDVVTKRTQYWTSLRKVSIITLTSSYSVS